MTPEYLGQVISIGVWSTVAMMSVVNFVRAGTSWLMPASMIGFGIAASVIVSGVYTLARMP